MEREWAFLLFLRRWFCLNRSYSRGIVAGMEAYIFPSAEIITSFSPWFHYSHSEPFGQQSWRIGGGGGGPPRRSFSFIPAQNCCKSQLCEKLSTPLSEGSLIDSLLHPLIGLNFCRFSILSVFHTYDTIVVSSADWASLFGFLFFPNSALHDSNSPLYPALPLTNPIISFRKVKKTLLSLATSMVVVWTAFLVFWRSPPLILSLCINVLFRFCLRA